jgi:phytoene/squalene synthetase
VPLTGFVFQVAGTSVVSVPALASTVKDTFERILPGQFLRQPADRLDNLNSEEVGSDPAWSAPVDAAARMAHPSRRGVPMHEASAAAMVSQADGERAALDQYFAQTADDTDPLMDDE